MITQNNKKLPEKMKQKSFWKKFAEKHWFGSDLPGSDPRFQPTLFAKWAGIFIGLPVAGFAIALALTTSGPEKKSNVFQRSADLKMDASRSQIVDFRASNSSGQYGAYVKRAPGTLVRVRLLNSVEGISGPVHAQILDGSLGTNLLGGSLLGEATGDTNLDRITINFNYARDHRNLSVAIPIKARALAQDGTLGINATKKEGMLARSTLGGGTKITQDAQGSVDSFDIRQIFMKALTSGFLSEAGGEINVERNRAALLVAKPDTEFFAELIDYFPGSSK